MSKTNSQITNIPNIINSIDDEFMLLLKKHIYSVILLPVCLEACTIMQEFINIIYNNCTMFTNKKDKSAVTLADIIIQSLLFILFNGYMENIIGEEELDFDFTNFKVNDETNKLAPITDLILQQSITNAYNNIMKLRTEKLESYSSIIRERRINNINDPIDGTYEFTQQTSGPTICIGFSEKSNEFSEKWLPTAGLIFRPIYKDLTTKPEYAMGCKKENFKQSNLNISNDHFKDFEDRILRTNGWVSSYFKSFINESNYSEVKSGGCGEKILLLLENKGDIYLQDRGVSRWDTCASQAILEANDGILITLKDFIDRKEFNSYNYKHSEKLNLDPNQEAYFCNINTIDREEGSELDAYINSKINREQIGEEIELVKKYSNLKGLIALPKHFVENQDKMEQLYTNIHKPMKLSSPILPIYN